MAVQSEGVWMVVGLGNGHVQLTTLRLSEGKTIFQRRIHKVCAHGRYLQRQTHALFMKIQRNQSLSRPYVALTTLHILVLCVQQHDAGVGEWCCALAGREGMCDRGVG
jgi:hypothetical protein